MTQRTELSTRHAGAGLAYFIAMLLVFSAVCSFLMYWIIPKFKEIHEGFGSDLPALTKHIINASDFAVNNAYLILPCLLVVLAGAALVVALLDSLNPAGYRSVGWMTQRFPRLKSPLVLRCLGLAVDARRSTEAALGEICASHPDIACRRLMAGVCAEIDGGSEPWATLWHRGMLTRREVAVLLAAQHAGNLAWALRELASSIESRLECRLRVVAEVMRPVGLIVAAGVIGVFVASMFMPLVKLLHDLS